MWTVPILFGVGCAAAFGFAARSRDPDAMHLALGLAGVWLCANLVWYFDSLWLLPALDWLFGTAAVVAWWGSRTKWVCLLVQLTTARLILHVLDYATGHAFLVGYIHGLNLLFLLELLAVSYEGWRDGVPMFYCIRRLSLFLRSSRSPEMKG